MYIFDESFEKEHPILYWNIAFFFKLVSLPAFFLSDLIDE
jgi:hypothetical protein